ncbi:unnamed protein product [Scytosiphon promiscuus]
MALEASVTVMGVQGDDDDEWGEEEEVVVWTRNSADITILNGENGDSSGVANAGLMREQGGHPRGLLIASLANLAISYNVVNVGLALKMMGTIYPSESSADESLVSSAAILGMMAGQLIFGALGDFLGRQLALCCTLLVCFAGAAGSAFLTFEDHGFGGDIFRQLLCWRVLLGIGAGGVYPLAATLARASRVSLPVCGGGEVGDGDGDTGSTAVALMFSMQGVGYLAAHATGFALLSALPETSPLAWRLLLGLGAVLPLVLVVVLILAFARARRYRLVRSALTGLGDEGVQDAMGAGEGERRGSYLGSEGGAGEGSNGGSPARFCLSVRNRRRLLMKLVGTAGSWFLFDVTFYGNQLYEDDVLEAVFGSAETLKDEASQDSIVALVALPGYLVAVALIGKMGPRRVQVQGFLIMAVLFGVIGLSFGLLQRHTAILMLLYSLTFFFSNFGPNSTTFMLPSLTFPDQVRGSLNGISAAAGKLGALMGSLLFKPAAEAWHVGPVLVLCALISLAGGVLTLAFVDSGEHSPILVGAEDSDDDGALGGADQDLRQEEMQMTNVATNGRRAAREGGDGMTARRNGRDGGHATSNGSAASGGGRRSAGPSATNSPMPTKRKKGVGGMYARVGDEGINGAGDRREYGMFGGSSEMVEFEEGGRGEGGEGFREGQGMGERYHTLGLGRTAEVEGQMEAGGGGRRWDGGSDSSDDDHLVGGGARVGNGLVEPA